MKHARRLAPILLLFFAPTFAAAAAPRSAGRSDIFSARRWTEAPRSPAIQKQPPAGFAGTDMPGTDAASARSSPDQSGVFLRETEYPGGIGSEVKKPAPHPESTVESGQSNVPPLAAAGRLGIGNAVRHDAIDPRIFTRRHITRAVAWMVRSGDAIGALKHLFDDPGASDPPRSSSQENPDVTAAGIYAVAGSSDFDRLFNDRAPDADLYPLAQTFQLYKTWDLPPYHVVAYQGRNNGSFYGIPLTRELAGRLPGLVRGERNLIKRMMTDFGSALRRLHGHGPEEDGDFSSGLQLLLPEWNGIPSPDLIVHGLIVELKHAATNGKALHIFQSQIDRANAQVSAHARYHGLGPGAAVIQLETYGGASLHMQDLYRELSRVINTWSLRSVKRVMLQRIYVLAGEQWSTFSRRRNGVYSYEEGLAIPEPLPAISYRSPWMEDIQKMSEEVRQDLADGHALAGITTAGQSVRQIRQEAEKKGLETPELLVADAWLRVERLLFNLPRYLDRGKTAKAERYWRDLCADLPGIVSAVTPRLPFPLLTKTAP